MKTIDYLNEEWRDVKGYEGYYQVSSLGRVKSLERYVIMNQKGDVALKKGKILKQLSGGSTPYYIVGLHKENVRTNYFVHRLVAEAFIPNPDNLPIINHKNEDKHDNCYQNLEWCTYSYNVTYGRLKTEGDSRKKVCQIDAETNEIIKEYNSINEASRETNIASTNIGCVCRGVRNRKTAGGFKWKFQE